MNIQHLNSMASMKDPIQCGISGLEQTRPPCVYDVSWEASPTTSSSGNLGNYSVARNIHNAMSSNHWAGSGQGVFSLCGVVGMGPIGPFAQQRVPVLPTQHGQIPLLGNSGVNAVRTTSLRSSGSNGHNAFGHHGFNPLSETYNRTSGYDFVNKVDTLRESLPQKVTDYVNHLFHDPSLEKKEIEDLLANIRPDMAIPEHDRGGTPEGLMGTLYPHQEVALAWLKKMEEGTNKGGILADDMGLGKTISMLSLILSRPATSRPKVSIA